MKKPISAKVEEDLNNQLEKEKETNVTIKEDKINDFEAEKKIEPNNETQIVSHTKKLNSKGKKAKNRKAQMEKENDESIQVLDEELNDFKKPDVQNETVEIKNEVNNELNNEPDNDHIMNNEEENNKQTNDLNNEPNNDINKGKEKPLTKKQLRKLKRNEDFLEKLTVEDNKNEFKENVNDIDDLKDKDKNEK